MSDLAQLRQNIRDAHLARDADVLRDLRHSANVPEEIRAWTEASAIQLVNDIRATGNPGMMEVFLAEYGLSTDEGIALMCLAEALLRVPDAQTMDDLIDDKITPSAWNEHLGKSSSSLVNASTWALMLTGKVLKEGQGIAASLKGVIKRLGEPVIRTAVQQAMKEMGRQFVLGQSITEALKRGQGQQAKGFTYSYDMLGEAALTAKDATQNFGEYAASIKALGPLCTTTNIAENPGISIKLSAIHPRYEYTQRARVMAELVPRVSELAVMASKAGMGLNIDAEEADRLDLSLDIIEAVLSDPKLAGWDGFGVVVQAYGKRAAPVIDWLYALATRLDRRIMVRLVKGAYWDTEIKQAQVEGLAGFPVFSRKEATDVSYICCAQKLLSMSDRIYPQFATHNAHTVTAILELADAGQKFEFQRLHGMGEALHDLVMQKHATKCRIYAPVGTHRDLLAYLVRRLLENGANSSFVNQIVSKEVAAETICADPFVELDNDRSTTSKAIIDPNKLFGDLRVNSKGYDLSDPDSVVRLDKARGAYKSATWHVEPLTVAPTKGRETYQIANPANPDDIVGTAILASAEDAAAAISNAKLWADDPKIRANALRKASDLFEDSSGELFAVLCREAGKTPDDAVSELREAVDFLRYYAGECERLTGSQARGIISCISPWNFPLAIFSGQIAAALAAGNAVLAKPAEATPIIAYLATKLLHHAGVPHASLQLLPGHGGVVGAAITSSAKVGGVCFTGSTNTAQRINRAMADTLPAGAPLIAETGGINAMIVDSTALPEQAVQDVINSAFKSAGQRCSALRILYLQEDVADDFLKMLFGAMGQLCVGDPWEYASDLGPIIDAPAQAAILDHINSSNENSRLLHQVAVPETGHFVGPAVISVTGISDIKREIFGPVLHVATFKADQLSQITDDINACGYGLTFGMHSRIDDRIAQVTARLNVGNIYINRNQIGAVVASQPFGGEGLSGTGPKAGGPSYVERFTASKTLHPRPVAGDPADIAAVQNLIDTCNPRRTLLGTRAMDGPTGESNQLTTFGRGVILCLGTSIEDAQMQARIAEQYGCTPVIIAPGATGQAAITGVLPLPTLAELTGFDGVVLWSSDQEQTTARIALASRSGPILPLFSERHFGERCQIERHICIDTTAAGGNAALLAAAS